MSAKKWAHVPGPALLRRWRTKANLNQQEAADLIEVAMAKYNAFENGRSRPGLEHAVRIAKVTKGVVAEWSWTEAAA